MNHMVKREMNIGKASLYAVIVNISEIVVLAGFVLYVLLTDITVGNHYAIQGMAILGSLMA